MILLFVDYWNMVEQPLIFLDDPFKQPLSVYLSQINGETGIAFAASMLYMAPMVLLFLYAETYFIEGIQLSGIKDNRGRAITATADRGRPDESNGGEAGRWSWQKRSRTAGANGSF